MNTWRCTTVSPKRLAAAQRNGAKRFAETDAALQGFF